MRFLHFLFLIIKWLFGLAIFALFVISGALFINSAYPESVPAPLVKYIDCLYDLPYLAEFSPSKTLPGKWQTGENCTYTETREYEKVAVWSGVCELELRQEGRKVTGTFSIKPISNKRKVTTIKKELRLELENQPIKRSNIETTFLDGVFRQNQITLIGTYDQKPVEMILSLTSDHLIVQKISDIVREDTGSKNVFEKSTLRLTKSQIE